MRGFQIWYLTLKHSTNQFALNIRKLWTRVTCFNPYGFLYIYNGDFMYPPRLQNWWYWKWYKQGHIHVLYQLDKVRLSGWEESWEGMSLGDVKDNRKTKQCFVQCTMYLYVNIFLFLAWQEGNCLKEYNKEETLHLLKEVQYMFSINKELNTECMVQYKLKKKKSNMHAGWFLFTFLGCVWLTVFRNRNTWNIS